MLFRRYLLSLLVLVAVLGLAASFLPSAARSHALAGATVDDTFSGHAIFNVTEEKFPSVQVRLPAILQENISFAGTGAVRVTSGTLEIPNPAFTRDSKGGYYSTPAIARVQWTALPAGPDTGTGGAVEIHYGPIESTYGFPARFDGGSSSTGLLRHVTVHGNSAALFVGRLFFGLAVALPLVFTLHTVWWIFVLRRERRKQLATLTPPEPVTLPVTFYPEPIFEWRTYTVMLLLFSLVGLFTLYVCRGSIGAGTPPPSFLILSVGVALSSGLLWLVRRNAVTLKLDETTLSYARGRGSKAWLTGHWADLRAVRIRTAMEKGVKHEWVEIEFPKGQKGPIYHRTILNYPLVRDTLLAMFAKHHPAGK